MMYCFVQDYEDRVYTLFNDPDLADELESTIRCARPDCFVTVLKFNMEHLAKAYAEELKKQGWREA